MTLEERVTKDFIIYIHSIQYDIVDRCLVIKFLKSPEEEPSIARILTFFNIQDFSEEIDEKDFDEDCLDSLIGIQEYPQKTGVRYVVRTEQREMIFFTEVEPQVQEWQN